MRPEPRRVGKHQRLIHPDKPVQIFVGARAGSALRQVPRAPEASTSGGHTPSAPAPPCQKSPLAKRLEGQIYSGEEKSMLLKWKPPQIVNGKDDDSLEATMRFMKETNKREKE